MVQWYAQVGPQRYGPISEQELRQWIAQGRVKPTDQVWSEGMAEWVSAQTLDQGGQQTSVPPCQPAVMPPYSSVFAAKPAKVQAIAILTLCAGIFDCLTGVGWACTCFLSPLGAYSMTVGILAIIYASRLLAVRPAVAPARYLAIMQIINIISGSVWSLVVGILCLTFYSDPQVQEYFESIKGNS